MQIRKNRILGVFQEGIFQDYEQALMQWEKAGNMQVISKIRNIEIDQSLSGKDILLCPFCEKPVRVKYHKNKKFPYFTHKGKNDANACIFEDKSQKELCKTIIRARKYEGRKTGHLHNKSVNQLEEIINYLPQYHLLKETEGRRLYHVNESGDYRIPDVLFAYNGKKYVIEVQNSPEWSKHIGERNKFYHENNMILLWFLTENSTLDNSVTASDIASRQKHNSFIFNDYCFHKSIERKNLFFLCDFDEPICEKQQDGTHKIIEYQRNEVISIDDLTFANECIYFYNYEFKYQKVNCDCIIKHELNDRTKKDIDLICYSHIFEAGYFAKYKQFPSHIKQKPIERLNTIAHDFIGVIYLYLSLAHYESYNHALSYDRSGKLKKKFSKGIDFWEAVKNNKFRKSTMLFTENHRTTLHTIDWWKKTTKSDHNRFLDAFPELKHIPQRVLNSISNFEKNIVPYLVE